MISTELSYEGMERNFAVLRTSKLKAMPSLPKELEEMKYVKSFSRTLCS